ncbi:MAG: TolC family protein, partial [Bacteroidota bacterium]
QAAYHADAARYDVSKDKAELLLAMKTAYWNLYRALAFKLVSEENVAVLTAHATDAENLLKQGMLTNNDLLKVKVQLSNAMLMQSDAGNRVQLAMISLNSLIGLPLGTTIVPASSLTMTTKEFPEIDSLLSAALDERPEVLGMEMRVRAAEAGVTSARAGWFPQVSLTGNYYYSRPNQRIFPALDEFRETWDVGISLQFELWNNLTTMHQTGAARAQQAQTEDALETLKDGITLEVTQGALNVRQAQQRIRLAELGVEQAAESYRMTADKFKSGLSTNSDLLDAEIALIQSKLQMTDALVEYELAQARLEKAVGDTK